MAIGGQQEPGRQHPFIEKGWFTEGELYTPEVRLTIERYPELQYFEYLACSNPYWGFRHFCAMWWRLINKEKEMQYFTFNPMQMKLDVGWTNQMIILKARKEGASTYVDVRFFWRTLFVPYLHTLIMAHEIAATAELYSRIQFGFSNLPDFLKPEIQSSNARRFSFINTPVIDYPDYHRTSLHSKVTVGTAGNHDFGRGGDIDQLHLSEMAFYSRPGETMAACAEALRKKAITVIECTPNGYNEFKEEWDAAMGRSRQRSAYTPYFFRWFDDPTNRKMFNASTPEEIESVPTEVNITPKERFVQITRILAATKKHYPNLSGRNAAIRRTKYRLLLPYAEDEVHLIETFGLKPEQINWRRWKKKSLKGKFKQEHPEDDVTCFLMSGLCVFDEDILRMIYMSLGEKQPIETRLNGRVQIWKRPEKDRRYVMATDASEGPTEVNDEGANRDPCGTGVLDVETGEQVAALHGRFRPEELAVLSAKLGEEYNWAMWAIERNNHGHSVINTARNTLQYPNLYRFADPSTRRRSREIGWIMNSATKPILIDDLDKAIIEHAMVINDREFVAECMTFVSMGGSKAGATVGANDDRVVYWGIAWQIRQRLLYTSGVKIRSINDVGEDEKGNQSDASSRIQENYETIEERGPKFA